MDALGDAIIGRNHPAGLLRAELDRATTSHGGLALVTGEPGIGKTTLVTSAAREARQRGALVLGAACWDSDSAPGYWPWVQVLRALRRSADDWAVARQSAEPALAALLGQSGAGGEQAGRLVSWAGVDPGPDAADQEAFALYDAVTAALVAVSQHRPVVVVLDDLHWADPASLRLLSFAAQHTWFERLLLIGTYRDAEVESGEHPLRPLLMPLVAKATTITLTGFTRDEVAALMTRTAGREPEASLVDEVHRRTGGNPFFVEQTARLWHADDAVGTIAPGVREAVRRRLAQLPAAVVEALTVAAVLGREFHRQVLAACAPAPAAQVDRLLDRAVTARLVVARGGGRFAFAHDLVRETLYDGLTDDDRRARHGAVVRAVDDLRELTDRLIPADLARHAYLAGPALDRARVATLLVAAGRDAFARLAGDEAAVHFRRALEVVEDPAQRVRILVEFAESHYHHARREEVTRLLAEAARLARSLDEPVLLARVALTVNRSRQVDTAQSTEAAELVREAYRRLIGEPDATATVGALVADLITASETIARRGQDDEALTFSLWARHDTTWGLGTAAARAALTAEIRDVARRTGDRETELWATSLRWVALLELGDPRFAEELTTFVDAERQGDFARHRLAAAVDSGIIAAFQGDFATADERFAILTDQTDPGHTEFGFMGHHLRWSRLLLQGRVAEAAALVDGLAPIDYPYRELLRAITAAERGDGETAIRLTAGIEADGIRYPRPVSPLWLRLRAQAAAASADPQRCDAARAALAPHRGEWTVGLFGCDISGPVDHWLALVDAAQERWDDAIAGFTAARDSADRLGSRPWSLLARTGLANALAGRGHPGDTVTSAALRAAAVQEATALGMTQVLHRLAAPTAPDADVPDQAVMSVQAAGSGQLVGPGQAIAPGQVADSGRAVGSGQVVAPGQAAPLATAIEGYEFRRDGPVWQLAYDGVVVHLPDAKGLHDLHLLLNRPGSDVPAVELLDPAAGPELVAARRMGADPVLDDEAKARYRRHLARLDEEIDRAAARDDDRKVSKLDVERGALLDELRAAAGLAGRSRRLGDEAERARKTVTARIRDTLRKLDDRHPALASHLRDAVSTGTTCRYLPPEPLRWRL
ncbi:Histidine kinase [Micromonospora noduli]|uniref:Histidine kinase n=1 Tax=Micromonospora noduli TaxID=709876 RepID=A0A328N9M9_9ACTN|nr:AAA family ATPase [Micromonospora noduli]KAB1927391.1 AAA family ATPase [Micromonospora noduli]RAO06131.1 Histidine kinase [Micromonospora noduli]RAO35439.1 Histidine kinase [Micromonospora noduli]